MTTNNWDGTSLRPFKKRLERVLFVAYYEPRSVPSIVDTVMLVQQLSIFSITVLNLAEHRFDSGFLKIPPSIDLRDFDAVILHNTVAYNVDNLRSLDNVLNIKFSEFQGVKIILKQDEHFRFSEFCAYADDIGVDSIFTVMPVSEVQKTYGRFLPNVKIHHMLTGYITPSVRNRRIYSGDRPIDIGYRGSIMPLSFGRLCYQKRKIGDEVNMRLAGRGLKLDISSRWEDRIGGDAWAGFLQSCKSVLGVESGTGLFDLDGTLDSRCKAVERKLGADDGSDAYAEAYLAELRQFEGEVRYFAISPRHFEAIAAGAIQLLMPGNYSGRMLAGVHYFELAEDYSNLEEGVDLVLDPARRAEMAAQAFEEVVGDRRNWIEFFVEAIDSALLEGLHAKGRVSKPQLSSQAKAKNVLLMQPHNFGCDPRRDVWYSAGAPAGVLVHQLGITDRGKEFFCAYGSKGELIVNLPRTRWGRARLDSYIAECGEDDAASAALRELYFIAQTSTFSDEELFKIYGMPASAQFSDRFRWMLGYVLDTAVTLIDAATRMQGVHAIVAINFPSLLPALVLRHLLKVPVIYEALEYWPEADPDQGSFAEIFWRELERRVVRYADHRGTVTPQLASCMSNTFGVPFYSVPNCIPLPHASGGLPKVPRATTKSGCEKVRFLFQGNFAPHRGLEFLIRVWNKVNSRAILVLRGPDNEFKQDILKLARGTGLLDQRIIFPEAVATERLIEAAGMDGDIGLVPYTATGVNYSNCSPNKLGQYLSIGLPILANKTNFLAETVNAGRCGVVIDFSFERELIDAIETLCNDEFRQQCSDNSYTLFKNAFNWNVASEPFYRAISQAINQADPSGLVFYSERNKTESEPLFRRLLAVTGVVNSTAGGTEAADSLPKNPVIENCTVSSTDINIVASAPPPQKFASRNNVAISDGVIGALRWCWRVTPERLKQRLRPYVRKLRQRFNF